MIRTRFINDAGLAAFGQVDVAAVVRRRYTERSTQWNALTAQIEKLRWPLRDALQILCDSFRAGAGQGAVKFPVGILYPFGIVQGSTPNADLAACESITAVTDAEFLRLPRKEVPDPLGETSLGAFGVFPVAVVVVCATITILGILAYKAITAHLDLASQALKLKQRILDDPNLTLDEKLKLLKEVDETLKNTPKPALDPTSLFGWVVGGLAVVLLGPPVIAALTARRQVAA